MATAESVPARFLSLKAAAAYYGVTERTFRLRIMPHAKAVDISDPASSRKRRLFSVDALEEARRALEKPAA